MRYARKRDVNERSIIEELEAAGYAVQQLDGSGVPDLLVGLGESLWLLEVKLPLTAGGAVQPGRNYSSKGGDGDLTAAQVKWWSRWKGPAPKIVRSAAEALEAIGAKR